ncbi:MAG: hypothetical protein IJZ13_09775 [Clostridia bacterium]|nr:hypothetical protein [Clostridia bacterium]
MQLAKISCKHFSRAQNIRISSRYIVVFTGACVRVLNKDLELLREIRGFYHIYDGRIAPDETQLLLISTANEFYTVSPEGQDPPQPQALTHHPINLEGQGCYSFDGREILLPLGQYSSTLRRYNASNLSDFTDISTGDLRLLSITPLPTLEKYLLLAREIGTQQEYFLWLSQNALRFFPLDKQGIIDRVQQVEYDFEKQQVLLYTPAGIQAFTTEGAYIPSADARIPLPGTCSYYNRQELLRGLKRLSGVDDDPHIPQTPTDIYGVTTSKDGNYLYIANEATLDIRSAASPQAPLYILRKSGLHTVRELAPDLLLLTTWDGNAVYRIAEI